MNAWARRLRALAHPTLAMLASCAAKLGESRLDLLTGCEAAVGGGPQTAIDAGELRGRRLVLALAEALVDIARDLGQFILRMSGPRIDALHHLGQQLGFHNCILHFFPRRAKRPVRRSLREGGSVPIEK